MFPTLRAIARDPEGKVLLGSALTTVTVGTVVYMFLEGWSPLDALYFSVVTLATVGFGDLHPTTNEAKLFTIVYIISGVGIIAGFVSTVAKHRTGTSRPTPVIDEVARVERAVANATHHGGQTPDSGDAATPPSSSSGISPSS